MIKRDKFAFVASEFEKNQEMTDEFFQFFMKMFEEADIHFADSYVVDGRMSAEEAQRAVAEADVVFLEKINWLDKGWKFLVRKVKG